MMDIMNAQEVMELVQKAKNQMKEWDDGKEQRQLLVEKLKEEEKLRITREEEFLAKEAEKMKIVQEAEKDLDEVSQKELKARTERFNSKLDNLCGKFFKRIYNLEDERDLLKSTLKDALKQKNDSDQRLTCALLQIENMLFECDQAKKIKNENIKLKNQITLLIKEKENERTKESNLEFQNEDSMGTSSPPENKPSGNDIVMQQQLTKPVDKKAEVRLEKPHMVPVVTEELKSQQSLAKKQSEVETFVPQKAPQSPLTEKFAEQKKRRALKNEKPAEKTHVQKFTKSKHNSASPDKQKNLNKANNKSTETSRNTQALGKKAPRATKENDTTVKNGHMTQALGKKAPGATKENDTAVKKGYIAQVLDKKAPRAAKDKPMAGLQKDVRMQSNDSQDWRNGKIAMTSVFIKEGIQQVKRNVPTDSKNQAKLESSQSVDDIKPKPKKSGSPGFKKHPGFTPKQSTPKVFYQNGHHFPSTECWE
uniref:Uncharacterized protein n=1 Tax=Clytia hemisphaerica TaxID=252671 RepID=A0A7M5UWM8_9CNID